MGSAKICDYCGKVASEKKEEFTVFDNDDFCEECCSILLLFLDALKKGKPYTYPGRSSSTSDKENNNEEK